MMFPAGDFTPERPLILFGCGAMAGAMLARWLATGLDPASVIVVRQSGAAVADGVRVVTPDSRDFPKPDVLMIGVKPQTLAAVLADIAAMIAPDTTLISILAGTELATLQAWFPENIIVRAMPNLPVAGGDGVVGLISADRASPQSNLVDRMMQPLGLVEWLSDETEFTALTALAGSGPAFLFRFVDALAKGGEQSGLAPDVALRLAKATVAGAARMAAEASDPPAILADRVASKGGSTRAGLNVLDQDDALDRLIIATLEAAVNRNLEMAVETRA